MQLHLPEPGYSESDRAQGNFRLALKLSLCFVLLLWIVTLLDWGLGLELTRFGVRPRSFSGLPGVLVAPFLHGDFPHLISNSLPLLVLGTGMLYLYPQSSLKVIPAVYLGPGFAVWLFGRPSLHIGASGLIYGTCDLHSHIRNHPTGHAGCKRLHARFFPLRDITLGLIARPFEYFLGNTPDSGPHWPGTCRTFSPTGCSVAKTLRLGE